MEHNPAIIMPRRMFVMLTGMTLLFLLVWQLPRLSLGTTLMPLWLHIVMEFFSIIVDMLIFGIAWNAYSSERPGNIIILATALLAVGLCDLAHTLSFRGMPDFITPSGPEKGINFWLAARAISSSALLAIAVRPWKPFAHAADRYWLLGATLAITALIYWLGLYHQEWWPQTYIEGVGLTHFKIGSEYLFIAMLLMSVLFFARRLQREGNQSESYLLAAAWISILSELCFTLYAEVGDLFNLLGHSYKVIAYIIIFRAVFVVSVREPYQRLHETRDELELQKRLLDAQGESTADGIITLGVAGEILWHNQRFAELWSIPAALLQARDIDKVNAAIRDRVDDYDAFMHRFDQLYANQESSGWDEIYFKDGRIMDRYSAPVRGTDGNYLGRIWLYRDISERKTAERRIRELAYFDTLTGLPNREQLNEKLESVIADAAAASNGCALLFIDLDRFKYINDSMGYAVGDILLYKVAQRLQNASGAAETVARVSGDEFVMLLRSSRSTDAQQRASELLQQLAAPYDIDGVQIISNASIGIALYPQHAQHAAALIQHANAAMYAAKSDGRNRYAFFTEELNRKALRVFSLEKDLRQALERNEFVLHYQPQIDLASGRICGAEALVRWVHPQRGMVPPGEFIALAEETGQIVELGRWILREACRQLAHWRSLELMDGAAVAVNLSVRQLQSPTFLDEVTDAIVSAGLEPGDLELEVTESILLGDNQAGLVLLRKIHEHGLQLSIDDFGTGYSSLSYLKHMPLDKLKIDQSFVREIGVDTATEAIIRSIITLGRQLGLTLIAEGVETESQLAFLQSSGCDHIQGYFLSRPLSAEDFTRFAQR